LTAATSRPAVQPTGCEILVAGLTVVALVSLFLPWYVVQVSDAFQAEQGSYFSALGGYAGGWRYACLVLAAVVLVFLAVRQLRPDLTARIPIPYRAVLATFAIATVAVFVIAFFVLPGGGTSYSIEGYQISVTQDWGAYVGLAAAVLAATAAIVNDPPEPAPPR
jgi:hypothetical protein